MNLTFQRPARGHYTEVEAARALEVSVEEFRWLVRRHILNADEDMLNLPIVTFQPSDLVLLRMLKMMQPVSPAVA
jgi:hypothetical protein